MLFVVIFFAMPVLALCYIVYVVSAGGKTTMSSCSTPLPPTPIYSTTSLVEAVQKKREIKWISTKEFEGLLRNCEEVIFIDLRSQARTEPIPFPLAHVLYVDSRHLLDILKWLPAASSAFLCGTPDLCASVFWTVCNISGFAPFYVLTEAPIGFGLA
jgi:hypothetical protein